VSSSNDGLYGASSTGNGVYGASNSGDGVFATSEYDIGVSAASNYGDGVYATSEQDIGVEGHSYQTCCAAFFEGIETALYAQATYCGSFGEPNPPFVVKDTQTDDGFYVDCGGDGYFSGAVTASAYHTFQHVRSGPPVEAFSPESTRATIEDTGTARLEGGEGAVRFDSTFANAIEAARGYQIFLTPNGETRGWLYVAAKYEGGFIVREAEHGRSSIYFDYRVVAHPYGASDARLPQSNIKRPAIPDPPRRVRPQ
jgi:hypothetical protein